MFCHALNVCKRYWAVNNDLWYQKSNLKRLLYVLVCDIGNYKNFCIYYLIALKHCFSKVVYVLLRIVIIDKSILKIDLKTHILLASLLVYEKTSRNGKHIATYIVTYAA